MKEIYQEGRVVGLSSYELWARQALSMDPDASILTEREWLASIISTNNSMVLRIKSGTSKGYHDYRLPSHSDLCSCTYIVATIFEGEATLNGNWATRIDDYGRLIANRGDLHPETPGEPDDVPVKEDYQVMSDEFVEQCKQYLKIDSGIGIQPGEWTDNVYQVPLCNEAGVELTTESNEVILADMSDAVARMTFSADLTRRGFIRILFKENITHDFYIILHGFSHKSLIIGTYGDLIGGIHPENGDFLGPELYPWATPVLFLYNSDVLTTMQNSFNSALSALSNQITLLNSKVELILGDISSITDEALRALEIAQQAARKAEEAAAEAQGLSGIVQETSAKTDRLSDDVSGLSSDVSGLSSDVADIEETTEEISSDVSGITSKIGNLNNLHTSAKNTVVAAINETYDGSKNALLYK